MKNIKVGRTVQPDSYNTVHTTLAVTCIHKGLMITRLCSLGDQKIRKLLLGWLAEKCTLGHASFVYSIITGSEEGLNMCRLDHYKCTDWTLDTSWGLRSTEALAMASDTEEKEIIFGYFLVPSRRWKRLRVHMRMHNAHFWRATSNLKLYK